MAVEYVDISCFANEKTCIIALRGNDKQIKTNYCGFWKKDKTQYYIEEFASIKK